VDSRRNFIGKMTGGIAGAVLGANDRVRLGVIGAGARGIELAREALGCANAEIAAFADVYAERLEQARHAAPGARMHGDFRALLEDQQIDAVLIATPQHLHAEQLIASLEAGKHVYQERVLAFTVEQAKRARAACERAGGRIVQVGHQGCSSGQVEDAKEFLAGGLVGKITAIRAQFYRNSPHGKGQWRRPVYPAMTAEKIHWKAFLGEAPEREFDADRFVNWRLYWDYSGGAVFEQMSQQAAFWYKVLDLGIPRAATMAGGVYLWKDGREAPDTMSVALEHEQGLLFSWDCGFGNNEPPTGEWALGTDGTIWRGQQIRYLPQKVNRPGGVQIAGRRPTAPRAMMRNFLEAIRGEAEADCPFELGFRVAIACRMALESYRLGRTVRWDPEREEIV
jgi:predicted dehydrogenase